MAAITGPADQQLAAVWNDLQQATQSNTETGKAVRSAAEQLFRVIAAHDLATMDADGPVQS